MSRYTSTNVSADATYGPQELIPDLVLPEVVATAVENEVFMPLSRRFDLTGAGANFAVPQAGALAWTTLDASAAVDPDETPFDTAARTLAPTLHNLDVVVPIDVWGATAMSLQAAIASEAGIGLANYRDEEFAKLESEAPTTTPDHFIGTDGTDLSFSDLRNGLGLLYTQKAPKRFAWVVHPDQFIELLKDNTFIDASVKGSPVLTQGIGANGFATSVLDVDVYVAEQILESSGRNSLMFSKNAALGYGFKRLAPPGGTAQEVMLDIEWNSSRRSVEINMTIHAHFEGVKGVSATANTWLVNIIS